MHINVSLATVIKSRLLLFAFLLYPTVSPAKSSEIHLLLNWMIDNHQTIETTLKDSNPSTLVPTIFTLIEIWKRRDGALSGEVSPLILKALIADPYTNLLLLSKQPLSFDNWLDELEGMAFTAYDTNDKAGLETLRVDVMQSLRSISEANEGKLTLMASQLINRLSHIEIRDIH
ncbi:hypothetical protein [Vibrio harveyi]|uniref:hypothetical protein n=1 Tax=Vibrio harveyi TaxID=669 RepID=UPI0031BA900B